MIFVLHTLSLDVSLQPLFEVATIVRLLTTDTILHHKFSEALLVSGC